MCWMECTTSLGICVVLCCVVLVPCLCCAVLCCAVLHAWMCTRDVMLIPCTAHAQHLDTIDPLYTILPSRLELKEETKIAATPGDELMWSRQHQQQQTQTQTQTQDGMTDVHADVAEVKRDESKEGGDSMMNDEKENEEKSGRFKRARLRSSPPPSRVTSPHDEPTPLTLSIPPTSTSPSDAESTYLAHTLASTHHGIVCDKCRTKDFTGVRYKCANCRDYDTCGGEKRGGGGGIASERLRTS